jgi:hypothetical protein
MTGERIEPAAADTVRNACVFQLASRSLDGSLRQPSATEPEPSAAVWHRNGMLPVVDSWGEERELPPFFGLPACINPWALRHVIGHGVQIPRAGGLGPAVLHRLRFSGV